MKTLLLIAVILVIFVLFSMAYLAACINHDEKKEGRGM